LTERIRTSGYEVAPLLKRGALQGIVDAANGEKAVLKLKVAAGTGEAESRLENGQMAFKTCC